MKLSFGLNPENKTMRVAFTLIDSYRWTGGYNYLLNLFRSIQKYQSDQIRPVLFCGEDASEDDLQPFYAMASLEVIRSPVFNIPEKKRRIIRSLFLGQDFAALRLFQKHQIDVVFENATFYGWNFPLPVIAWMPDFQHRHMREQFGFVAYWRRELGFRAQVISCSILMLSSEDARKDSELFYPRAINNTTVVRFAAPIPAKLIENDPVDSIQEYRLPPQFFYLPKQFWKHKNHRVVIEALGLLKQQGCELVVVASGNQKDPRHPEYLTELNSRIKSLGLHENFRMLGLIPRRHVISLMRTCTALLNPSYFEGWSSTVEEARTLGVSMLLSDIGVHREQMEGNAIYFPPNDAFVLAEKLKKIALEVPLPPSGVEKLTYINDDNIRRFAYDFVAAAEQAIRSYHTKRYLS